MTDLTLAEAGVLLKTMFTQGKVSGSKFQQWFLHSQLFPSGQVVRDLLPLPVPTDAVEELDWTSYLKGSSRRGLRDVTATALLRAAGARAWLWCTVLALNLLYSGRRSLEPCMGLVGPASLLQQDRVHTLLMACTKLVACDEKIPFFKHIKYHIKER